MNAVVSPKPVEPPASALTAALGAEGLGKTYGQITVLSDVTLDILPGEVHAVIGENGAGKSTLMKLLSGYVAPSAGSLSMEGRPVAFRNAVEAEAAGIVLVHQEILLAGDLTVAENLFLGREVTRFGVLDRRFMRAETRRVLDMLGSEVDENALIGSLAVADKQMVEIAKAISRDARVVIMDEPTAVLSREETRVLFDQVRKLRAAGTSFIFVSHKLDEVMELTDRVTVLRDGQWVKTARTEVLDGESIAQLMVGRELSSLYPAKHEPDIDENILLSVRSVSTGFVKEASFEIRRGEIIGFSGLIGSGRTELMEAVVGLRPRLSGHVAVRGQELPSGDVHAAIRAGLAYMTKDRKQKGLLLGEGMTANLTLQSLARHSRRGYLDPASEAAAMDRARRRFDIRVRDNAVAVGRMSGGNQQKLLLAKVMETEPQIIIIDEPTRGIDVGTKQQIYHFISALAREGRAIVVVSSEMPEVIGLCTRVAVMREGRIAGILEGSEINEHEIMRYAAGLKSKAA